MSTKKKYNNKSEDVKDWTTPYLKKQTLSVFCSIYQIECFGSGDLVEYQALASELERRGYELKETKFLNIEKA